MKKERRMKKRKFYFRTLVGAGLIAAAAAFPAFADNWIHQENGWVCKTADGYMQTGWYQDKNNGGKWYYLWPEAGNRLGCMQTGWLQKDGKWYFFDTRSGSSGAMLTGWQWIDGKCYYLDPAAGGAMAISNTLSDGSHVGSDGAWVDGSGNAVYQAGKGIPGSGNTVNSNTNTNTSQNQSSDTSKKSKRPAWWDNENLTEVQKVAKDFGNNYITDDMTDFEKEMEIIQYMVQNITYDYDNFLEETVPGTSYGTTGALLYGTAVCAGYTDTFTLLADACGLETMEVSGEGNGVGGWGGHAWNKIKLDGEWYHVDVTWEDPIMNGDPENGYGYGNLRNEYINITDSKMAKDHRWTAKEPACKATKYGRSAVSKYMKKRY